MFPRMMLSVIIVVVMVWDMGMFFAMRSDAVFDGMGGTVLESMEMVVVGDAVDVEI